MSIVPPRRCPGSSWVLRPSGRICGLQDGPGSRSKVPLGRAQTRSSVAPRGRSILGASRALRRGSKYIGCCGHAAAARSSLLSAGDLYRSLTTKCKRLLVPTEKCASTWSIWHQATNTPQGLDYCWSLMNETSPSLEAESKTWAPSCNSAEVPPHQPSRGGALNSAPTSGMLEDSKSLEKCYHYKSSS